MNKHRYRISAFHLVSVVELVGTAYRGLHVDNNVGGGLRWEAEGLNAFGTS